MGRAFLAVAAIATMLGSALRAGEPVVVELFTSQGCSSCPPADALLAQLTEREDVIPLALHVDYWDYIGWEDRFAKPAFTRRQKGYAKAHGARTVYTPQMVIAGQSAIVGHKPLELAERIMRVLDAPSQLALEVTLEEGTVVVQLSAQEPVEGDLLIHLVRYEPRETVAIRRGENAGRTYTYHNIVTSWETMARWNGQDALAVRHDAPGDRPIVVLVQKAGYGPILAAARAR
jgi:hypothetical protein